MPTLTPSDYDEDDDNSDFLTNFVGDALRPSSAQQDQSTATQMTSIISTLGDKMQSTTEQQQNCGEDGGDEGESTTFAEILSDAQHNFHDEKPEFAIRGTPATFGAVKLVSMGGGQTAEMTFVAWDETKDLGYWVLEDNYRHKHIVKFFNRGKCYKAWLGTEHGFNDDPIAWSEKKSETRSLTVEEDADSIEYDGTSSGKGQASGRRLRKKTYTQKHPYAADREVHNATKQGMVKRASEINAREAKRDKCFKRAAPATPRQISGATQKKQRRARSTTSDLPEPARTPEELRAHINARTSLRTKLPPDDEPLVIYLSECLDATELWDKVVAMWASEIEGTVKSMSIQFPWLGFEYNLKLKAGLAGPYDKMIEEILDAPCWKDGTDRCSVDIVLIEA
jgi:hypothetical protein